MNAPDGATAISDVALLPVNEGGSVVITCSGISSPRSGSNRNVVIVESSSLIWYRYGLLGWKATGRGPAPGRLATEGGAAAASLPVAVSGREAEGAARAL